MADDNETQGTAAKRPTRRRRSTAKKAVQTATEIAATKAEAAADAKIASATTSASGASTSGGSRRRGGRRAKKEAPSEKPAATAKASADSTNAIDDELLTLLRRQTDLLDQQTEFLRSLASASQDGSQALRQAVGTGTGGDIALEVKPRLAIFVDVPNILYGAERSGVVVDWGKVSAFLAKGRTLVRSVAYAPISDDPSASRENERFVLPFLDKDYRIVMKPLKRFSGGSVKANFDVELAIDILTMADRLDVIALASGDGDFRRLVEVVGSRGVRVEVLAFGHSTSADLREVADRYVDIAAYVPELCT